MTNDAKVNVQWNIDRFLQCIQQTEAEAEPNDLYAKYEQMGRYLVMLLEHSLAAFPLSMRKQIQECFAIRERTLAAWYEENAALVARICQTQQKTSPSSLAASDSL